MYITVAKSNVKYLFKSVVCFILLILLAQIVIHKVIYCNCENDGNEQSGCREVCLAEKNFITNFFYSPSEEWREELVPTYQYDMLFDYDLIKEVSATFFYTRYDSIELYKTTKNKGKSENTTKHTLTPQIMKYFNGLKYGYFMEFGAGNGITSSPTYELEKNYNWSGLLVEADYETGNQLLKSNRRSMISLSCLGDKATSFEAIFGAKKNQESKLVGESWEIFDNIFHVMCYPLFSYILASKTLKIHVLIIDINKNELSVLESTPFESFIVQLVIVRYRSSNELQNIQRFIATKGFTFVRVDKKSRYIMFKGKKQY